MKKVILVIAIILFCLPIALNLNFKPKRNVDVEGTEIKSAEYYRKQLEENPNRRLLTKVVNSDGLKIRINALVEIKGGGSKEVINVSDQYMEVINSPVPIEFQNLNFDMWTNENESYISYSFSADAMAVVRRFSQPKVTSKLKNMGFEQVGKSNEGYIYQKYVDGSGDIFVK